MRRRPPYRAARRPSCKYAVNIGSDSHLMNLAGDFAVLQWGNQRHANLSLLKTLNVGEIPGFLGFRSFE